jgi:hypothetical protein
LIPYTPAIAFQIRNAQVCFFEITAMLGSFFTESLWRPSSILFNLLSKEGRMMKKMILRTVVSLLVFSGFVAGPWEADLAEALTAAQLAELTALNPDAVIAITQGHNISLLVDKGKKTPKKDSAGNRDAQISQPTEFPEVVKGKDLKNDFKQTKGTNKFKHEFGADDDVPVSTILVLGDNTCVYWNGTAYCW